MSEGEDVRFRARESGAHVPGTPLPAGRGLTGLAPSAAPPSAGTSTMTRHGARGSVSTLASEMNMDHDMDFTPALPDEDEPAETPVASKDAKNHRRGDRSHSTDGREDHGSTAEADFQIPPRKKQARHQQLILARELNVTNRYEPLQGTGVSLDAANDNLVEKQRQRDEEQRRQNTPADTGNDDDMEADAQPTPPAGPKRIPPITLRYKESYKELHTWLKTNCKAAFTVRQTGGETLKLLLNTTEDYVNVVGKLGEEGIPMYTTPAVRPPTIKTLIKGVPTTVTHSELEEELEDLGYVATLIEHHKMPGTNQLTGHRVVILPDTPEHRGIFQLTRIYDLSVKVERLRRSRGHIQCYRCQAFNHVARYCTMPPVCVKCGAGLDSRECTRSREEAPTCGLCGRAHPANYRTCPKHKQASRRYRGLPPMKKPSTRRQRPPPPPPPPTVDPSSWPTPMQHRANRLRAELTAAEALKQGLQPHTSTSIPTSQRLTVPPAYGPQPANAPRQPSPPPRTEQPDIHVLLAQVASTLAEVSRALAQLPKTTPPPSRGRSAER
ncbi:bromodomain-containing protein 4-like [Schistocerca americana]|uniref:bromodomain-containing protein 4-like n=1 Tax=Schistocerca americana TaxID=7009 RepID=UPI001F5025BF|nr:bromodomain-containing protein 4-like [Schistocerca americana]